MVCVMLLAGGYLSKWEKKAALQRTAAQTEALLLCGLFLQM